MNTQETLHQKIHKLCTTMAKGYYNAKMYEDLLQEGILACYEVLHRYDPDDYDNPEQFFWIRARRGMSDYYQRRSKLVVPPKGYKVPSGDTPSAQDIRASQLAYIDADDCSGNDELRTGDEQRSNLEYDDHKQWLTRRFFDSMSYREKQIIYIRYFSSPDHVMTYHNTGKLLDTPLTGRRVCQIETEVMERFR